MATYPKNDLRRALGRMDWEKVTIHQRVEGQHRVKSLGEDDVEISVEGGCTYVHVDSQNTPLLGKFSNQLEQTLNDSSTDTETNAAVQQDNTTSNRFRILSVNSDMSNQRGRPHSL